MPQFNNYTHQESIVQAIQLSSDTYPEIVTSLGRELENGLLATFNATYNSNDQCYEFTFRYKTDSVESKVTVTDYLVQLNAANYVVRDAKTFEQEYLPTYKDEEVMPDHPQTPMGALITFIKSFFPDIVIEDSKLSEEQLAQVLEGVKSWYDAETDQFNVAFSNCGIIDPTGLADFLKAFPRASYIKDTTTYILDFHNGKADPNGNNQSNMFNKAGLDSLVGEMKKLDKNIVKQLTHINFSSLESTVHNAIAPSVTDAEFTQFCTDIMSVTGIKSTGDIKR